VQTKFRFQKVIWHASPVELPAQSWKCQ